MLKAITVSTKESNTKQFKTQNKIRYKAKAKAKRNETKPNQTKMSAPTTTEKLYVTDPEKWLNEIRDKNDFVGVVIFRGSWCKYDRYYLQKLGDYSKGKMANHNLHLIAWTSEGEEGAKKADEEWALTKDHGFDQVVGDETCALSKYLLGDYLLEKLITSPFKDIRPSDKTESPGTYPNGVVQPGMIWYAHHTVVLEWEATVKAPHLGATDRPDPKALFEEVLKRKHELDRGDAVLLVHGNRLKQCCTPMEVNCAIM